MENAPYCPPAGLRMGKITRKPVGSALQSQSNNPFKEPPSLQAKSNNPFAVAPTGHSTAPDDIVSTWASNHLAALTCPFSQSTQHFATACHPSSPISRSSSTTTNPFTPSADLSTPSSPFTASPSTSLLAPAVAASNRTTGDGRPGLSQPVATNRPSLSSRITLGFEASQTVLTAFSASIGNQQPAFSEPDMTPPQQPGSLSAAAVADLEMQQLIAGFAAEQRSNRTQLPHGGIGDEARPRLTAYGPMPGLGEKTFNSNSNRPHSTQRAMPNASRNQSSNNSTNQAPPQASNVNPMPGFDQAEFNTNPQYREYISARLSGQYGGTFAEYVIETMPAKPKEAPLLYLRNNVIYYSDGAAAVKGANIMTTN